MENSAAQFWDWFRRSHERFRSLNVGDQEALSDEFLSHLRSYDAELSFEVSEPLEDGSNELIITAQGRTDRFASVDALIADAPQLPGWKFIALKPPLDFDFVHDFDGIVVNPRELWFLPLTSKSAPTSLGLRVGIPSVDGPGATRLLNAVWIIIDTGIGERACAEEVQHMEVVPLPPTPAEEGYFELPLLPNYLAFRAKEKREQVMQ